MQQLTELQEKWLKALESGEYRQGRKRLGSEDVGLCCLGLACLIAGETYDPRHAYPSRSFAIKLGLKDESGSVRRDLFYAPSLSNSFSGLAQANDHGATFSEIAAAIRSNPENFFLPPEAV